MRRNYIIYLTIVLSIAFMAVSCNGAKSYGKKAAKIDCQGDEISDKIDDLNEDLADLDEDDDDDRKEIAKLEKKKAKLEKKLSKLHLKQLDLQQKALKKFSNEDKWEDFDEDASEAYDDYDCD